MSKTVLTVEGLCGGAVQERINRALAKVVDNILDPNTEAKKKRSITLKLSFVPNEDDREDVAVGAEVNYSLAPEEGTGTHLFVSKDPNSKQITITEHQKGEIKGQLSLDDYGMMIQDREPSVDPETGEILEESDSEKVIDFREAVNQ